MLKVLCVKFVQIYWMCTCRFANIHWFSCKNVFYWRFCTMPGKKLNFPLEYINAYIYWQIEKKNNGNILRPFTSDANFFSHVPLLIYVIRISLDLKRKIEWFFFIGNFQTFLFFLFTKVKENGTNWYEIINTLPFSSAVISTEIAFNEMSVLSYFFHGTIWNYFGEWNKYFHIGRNKFWYGNGDNFDSNKRTKSVFSQSAIVMVLIDSHG